MYKSIPKDKQRAAPPEAFIILTCGDTVARWRDQLSKLNPKENRKWKARSVGKRSESMKVVYAHGAFCSYKLRRRCRHVAHVLITLTLMVVATAGIPELVRGNMHICTKP